MNRRGLYVPKPYPDELLYSVIGRFARHTNLEHIRHVVELLFDSKSIVATPDLQGRLGRLRWLFEDRWHIPLRKAVMRYTLLPYYAANRGRVETGKLIDALVREEGSALHTRLGICASTVHTPESLKFCPDCAQEDIQQYGEPYWHRVHQLPGVLVCPDHGVSLLDTEVPMRPTNRHEFRSLTRQIIEEYAFKQDAEEVDGNLAWEIAKRSRTLLDMPYDASSACDRNSIRDSLYKLGYDNRHGGTKRLEEDLIAFFGWNLLSKIDGSFTRGKPIHWLRCIRQSRGRTLHPLRQILLHIFIEIKASKQGQRPFGDGPWPCLNPLAKHYRLPVVTDMEEFADKRHPGRQLARFSCSCGYVYSQRADQYSADKPYQVIQFGPLFEIEAQDLFKRGYKVGAIARMLEIDWKTTKRMIDGPVGKKTDDQHPIDTQKWLDLVATNPGRGVKALRKQEPALYARLYRNKHAWLLVHSPKEAKPNYGNEQRVNWEERDLALVKKVQVLAEDIIKEVPPVRITRNLIATRLSVRALIQKKINKLPKTQAVLQAVEESVDAFRLRRLRTAFHKIGPSVSKSVILHAANIRKEYVTCEIKEELERLYAEKYEPHEKAA